MKPHPHPRTARSGFTLIELLITVGIILVLVSLVAAVALRALGKGDEVVNRTDISQLSTAINSFQNHFKVNYMPSRVRILESGQYGSSADAVTKQRELDTLAFLGRMWPRMNLASAYNWDGDGTQNEIHELTGEQCLVFFLGGAQFTSASGKACLGFSSNPLSPTAAPTAAETRIGPFYPFKSERLVPGPGGYFGYNDPYGSAYLYFSSRGTNDYRADCQTPPGVAPYLLQATPSIIPYKPNSFQIISAGKNKLYGPGGVWSSTTGYAAGSPGVDDLSNFHDRVLGNP